MYLFSLVAGRPDFHDIITPIRPRLYVLSKQYYEGVPRALEMRYLCLTSDILLQLLLSSASISCTYMYLTYVGIYIHMYASKYASRIIVPT